MGWVGGGPAGGTVAADERRRWACGKDAAVGEGDEGWEGPDT